MLIPSTAKNVLHRCHIPHTTGAAPDFHTLSSAQVDALLIEANMRRYRQSKNASGSRVRVFYAYVCRRAFPKWVNEWQVQGDYGQGWECVTAGECWNEARSLLRDYRENEPGIRFRVMCVKVRP